MSVPEVEASSKRSITQQVFFVVTTIIAIACLVYVLHDLDFEELSQEVANLNWGWVALAAIADVLVYFWQGWRWSLLLSPLGHVPFWRSVRAIYVGLFANEILPFRTGEIIRCYLQARWSKFPFTVALSSALIERVFDGIWLIICLLVTIRFVPLPHYMVEGGIVLSAVVLLLALLLGAAMFWKKEAHEAFRRNRLLSKVAVLLDDLHLIGHSPFLYFSAFASLPYLLMQVLPIYFLARGYPGLDLSLGQAAALMVILRMGSVVPQAPGNVGTFQLLTVMGLGLFGVDTAIGKRFSLVMWSVITLPLLLTGFFALAITGLKMGEIQRDAEVTSKNLARPQPETN